MIPFVDFKSEYAEISEEVNPAIQRVLERGWFILGEELEGLEKEFSKYIGSKYGIGVSSGTDAIMLSLMSLGIGSGDEVITVSHTSSATVSAISITGAKAVFVDVEEDTALMDVNKVESKITNKTKAVVPVHLYGHPVDLDPLLEVSKKYGIAVVEDCAQAHGAGYKGKKVGTIGKLGAFSFYPTKNLGAYGDAGMIVTDDKELYRKLLLLRQYGWEEKDNSVIRGVNSRLDEIQAAILRVKLKYLDGWNEKRRVNAGLYYELLEGLDIAKPIEKDYAKHVYHLYVIKSGKRDALKVHLQEQGVQTQIHYRIPVHRQKTYETNVRLPITEKVCEQILSLPIQPYLREEEIITIAKCVKNMLK